MDIFKDKVLSKGMLMVGQEFKRSKTLEISTALQCHAKNVQEVSEGDIQMFVP